MKLEITKEKVLEAASKCSQAKETLKTLFPEAFEGEEKYSRGDRFMCSFDDEEYILCCVCGNAYLFCLRNGNVWTSDTVKVDAITSITTAEFERIAAGQPYLFTKKVTNQ